jgi:transcriptional regulator with XRE-family HTH domain
MSSLCKIYFRSLWRAREERLLKLPRLREVRELRGWSQGVLAEKADVSRDSISNYETGHREAYPATARKLADALEVGIGALVEPTRVEEPALAGKDEAPPSGRLPEWATTSDLNVLNQNSSEISSEELRSVIILLAKGLQANRTLEDLRNEPRSESTARVLNQARINAIGEELRRRGEEPPEEYVIAFRQWLKAMTLPPDAEPQSDTGHGISEAG